MARERMVTRTVTKIEVTVLRLNTVTAEPHNDTFIVPLTADTEEKMLKYINKHYDTEIEKSVTVTNVSKTEVRYGMSEIKFIENAEILPPLKSEVESEEN